MKILDPKNREWETTHKLTRERLQTFILPESYVFMFCSLVVVVVIVLHHSNSLLLNEKCAMHVKKNY